MFLDRYEKWYIVDKYTYILLEFSIKINTCSYKLRLVSIILNKCLSFIDKYDRF